jgi:hypothetical protein
MQGMVSNHLSLALIEGTNQILKGGGIVSLISASIREKAEEQAWEEAKGRKSQKR